MPVHVDENMTVMKNSTLPTMNLQRAPSARQQGNIPPVDWSEFSNWCFVNHDLVKVNVKLSRLHKGEVRGRRTGVIIHDKLVDIGDRIAGNKAVDHHTFAQFTAGALGGGTSTYATHWLDTIKVKMQTFPDEYRSGPQTLRTTLQSEGLAGLYQGAMPAVIGHMTKSAVVFTSYGFCEDIVCVIANKSQLEELTVWHHAAAGAMTGITASFILCPLELIKCRLQALQNGAVTKHTTESFKNSSPWSMTRRILRKEGARGMYRGLTGMWIKEIPGSFIYFGSYELGKKILHELSETDTLGRPMAHIMEGSRGVFVAGMFAGLCFCITHPIESVKTRVQVKSAFSSTKGFVRTAISILRKEGLAPLFSGLKPTMIRACLYSGIQFMVYEAVRDSLYEH